VLSRQTRRATLSICLALTLGAFLGLTTVALGVHRHEYSRWDHGLMNECNGGSTCIAHPALISTDGIARYGCVAHAYNGNHGYISCATDNHIHRYTDTLSTYCNQSAHAESSSSSASLDHHHHFPHSC
jgi:hypothetical protein